MASVRWYSFVFLCMVLGLAGDVPAADGRPGPREMVSINYGRIPDGIFAVRPPYLFRHNVGLLSLGLTNAGIIGNPFVTDLSAGWDGGEYLYDSSLWIAAIGSDSEIHVSSSRYPTSFELRPERDARWTIYESYEGIRGGVRPGSFNTQAADDDGDGLFDEDFQNGLDDDGDGRIDEDFAAIGQQMFSCVYRDDTVEAIAGEPDHVPLNIMVQQRSFQWSTPGINEFVGFDFRIINVGDQRLKDLFIGFFSDSDAGPKQTPGFWTDDLVGWAHIDTTIVKPGDDGACGRLPLSIDTAYIYDAPDNGVDITGGDVTGVFGSLFLGHTTDDTGLRAPQTVGLTSVAWFSSSGQNSDPQNDEERYQLLARGTKPARNAVKPDDYRYVISAGPFADLNPGESLSFQCAYVIGEGQQGFRVNAVNAQRIFNGQYVDADQNVETGVDGKERCLQVLEIGEAVRWDDPCDTLTTVVTYRQTPPCSVPGQHYVDADCNACTGVMGRELLVNWVGTTSPPPPGMNTNVNNPGVNLHVTAPAGDRHVTLQWDNGSELVPDPITGEDVFVGYRIWRVDNWQRPEGSIGPSQEEWMKIAEFRRDPDNVPATGIRPLLVPFPEGALNRLVDPVQFTDDGRPIYPVGRYQYTDSLGILNGKVYFYAITAVGIAHVPNPLTQVIEEVELTSLPSAVESEAVVPRWDTGSGCDAVRVVPNPYRGGAEWDLIPSDRDPTGTKLAFRNLPETRSTVRIYTLSGDLVQEVEHDGRDGDGTYFWNMISRNGQDVVSGVYLFSVQHPGGTCRGRFVIIR